MADVEGHIFPWVAGGAAGARPEWQNVAREATGGRTRKKPSALSPADVERARRASAGSHRALGARDAAAPALPPSPPSGPRRRRPDEQTRLLPGEKSESSGSMSGRHSQWQFARPAHLEQPLDRHIFHADSPASASGLSSAPSAGMEAKLSRSCSLERRGAVRRLFPCRWLRRFFRRYRLRLLGRRAQELYMRRKASYIASPDRPHHPFNFGAKSLLWPYANVRRGSIASLSRDGTLVRRRAAYRPRPSSAERPLTMPWTRLTLPSRAVRAAAPDTPDATDPELDTLRLFTPTPEPGKQPPVGDTPQAGPVPAAARTRPLPQSPFSPTGVHSRDPLLSRDSAAVSRGAPEIPRNAGDAMNLVSLWSAYLRRAVAVRAMLRQELELKRGSVKSAQSPQNGQPAAERARNIDDASSGNRDSASEAEFDFGTERAGSNGETGPRPPAEDTTLIEAKPTTNRMRSLDVYELSKRYSALFDAEQPEFGPAYPFEPPRPLFSDSSTHSRSSSEHSSAPLLQGFPLSPKSHKHRSVSLQTVRPLQKVRSQPLGTHSSPIAARLRTCSWTPPNFKYAAGSRCASENVEYNERTLADWRQLRRSSVWVTETSPPQSPGPQSSATPVPTVTPTSPRSVISSPQRQRFPAAASVTPASDHELCTHRRVASSPVPGVGKSPTARSPNSRIPPPRALRKANGSSPLGRRSKDTLSKTITEKADSATAPIPPPHSPKNLAALSPRAEAVESRQGAAALSRIMYEAPLEDANSEHKASPKLSKPKPAGDLILGPSSGLFDPSPPLVLPPNSSSSLTQSDEASTISSAWPIVLGAAIPIRPHRSCASVSFPRGLSSLSNLDRIPRRALSQIESSTEDSEEILTTMYQQRPRLCQHTSDLPILQSTLRCNWSAASELESELSEQNNLQ